ncbi:hypothetical protein EB796_016582 [Bugula neritina]|uniref:Uncharacterized protein n=1 Tax=Bugula neritina TaxID=10212 RepID=A0A7J7JH25_BUGNE|nr:hypothetical protein EB796_016582 [Bugula neritina]
MGMPVKNGNLISIGKNTIAGGTDTTREKAILLPGANARGEWSQERKLSAPELPPIGAKPHSPSYNSPTQRRQYDVPLELNLDHPPKRSNRKSPLSPTSTTSSHDGSNRSTRLSPAAGGLNRSRTWTGDLNSSQNMNGRLETLYEIGAPGSLQSGLAQLAISQNGIIKNETKLIPNSTITTPPPITDRHISIRSTQMVTVISPDTNNNPPLLPTPPDTKSPNQMPASRLSQENLSKLRHCSQSSSLSSSIAPLNGNSDAGYDTDDEKDKRIVEWLIGLEESQIEQPPETTDLDTNEKRDTAIHIVYEGD